MTTQAHLQKTGEGLLISGAPFNLDGEGEWDLLPFDGARWLLCGKRQQQHLGAFEGMAGAVDSEILTATLLGLLERRFSGVLVVDTGRGVKKLFFQRGELAFAKSNLIDDRLGEVMFRAGFISLEHMTTFAVQVNRTTRFGRVLLNNNLMTSVELWNALKLQVAEIVRSVFLVERSYIQFQKVDVKPPTSVVFTQGTRDLIAECSGFGAMFRHFVRRLTLETRVRLLDKVPGWVEPAEGTFDSDLCVLIREHATLGDLKRNSKLSDINTWFALFQLVNRGLCALENLRSEDSVAITPDGPWALKQRIEGYSRLLETVRRAFRESKVRFPVSELQLFVRSLGAEKPVALYLTSSGDISPECAASLYRQVWDDERRLRRIETQLESLIQFLSQLVSDFLSVEKAKEVRQFLLEQGT